MKIAVFGDLHYPAIDERVPGLLEARAAFYEQFATDLLAIEADYYVSLGDLTNFGSPHELRSIFSLLNYNEKFIHVQGNHDNYTLTKTDIFKLTQQQRYHSIDMEQATLVFLDTARELDFECWGGDIDKEQLIWFEQTLEQAGEKPVLVFAHHPVYNTTLHSDTENGSIDSSIDMWHYLNKKKGIGLYINGHLHVDSIYRQDNWTFVQTAAYLDDQAFRLIEITNEHISISSIDVENDELKEFAEKVYENMNHFTHKPNVRGTNCQRACTIPLNEPSISL